MFGFRRSATIEVLPAESIEGKPNDFSRWFEELGREYADSSAAAGRRYRLDFDCLQVAIHQASAELVTNAYDSIRRRQRSEAIPSPGKIDIGMRVREDDLYVRVQDDGAGVSLSVAQYLFSQMPEDLPAEERKELADTGTGLLGRKRLGLFMLKQSVDALRGSVGYASMQGSSGAVFWYEFPLSSVALPAAFRYG